MDLFKAKKWTFLRPKLDLFKAKNGHFKAKNGPIFCTIAEIWLKSTKNEPKVTQNLENGQNDTLTASNLMFLFPCFGANDRNVIHLCYFCLKMTLISNLLFARSFNFSALFRVFQTPKTFRSGQRNVHTESKHKKVAKRKDFFFKNSPVLCVSHFIESRTKHFFSNFFFRYCPVGVN